MQWFHSLQRVLQQRSMPSVAAAPGKETSVLALLGLWPETSAPVLVLMKRTMTLGTHRGQVGFPGGYREPGDGDLLATAVRETQEEIGLKPGAAEILGPLSPVQTRNEVWIFPWVGVLRFPYPFVENRAEVDKLLFLPIERLLREGLVPTRVQIEGITLQSPGIAVDGELVWGATARMLDELRTLWLEANP